MLSTCTNTIAQKCKGEVGGINLLLQLNNVDCMVVETQTGKTRETNVDMQVL